MKHRLLAGVVAVASSIVLVSCGGGGYSSSSGTTTSTTTTISGSAVKGPVANATVTIKNASTGATIATTTTNSSGAYSVDVSYYGDVVVEISGGTYTDEATGVSTSLSTPMRAVLTSTGSSVTGVVTPLTTLAYTNAFGSGSGAVTASAFNTAASNLASQFQLSGVSLTGTTPVVTGSTNAYGQVLRGISQYLSSQNTSLANLVTSQMTADQLTAFQTAFNSAYAAANPGSSVTFAFTTNGFNISGTGGGGGTGTCGVSVSGTITQNNITIPISYNYCVTGIAAGSCTSGNSSLSQAVATQLGSTGANLNYSYSSTCASGAFTINLQ